MTKKSTSYIPAGMQGITTHLWFNGELCSGS